MTEDNQPSFRLPSVSRKQIPAAFDVVRFSSDSGVEGGNPAPRQHAARLAHRRVGDLAAATRTATTSIGSGSIPALKLERAIPRTPRTRSPRIWASRSHLILTSRALLTRTCKVQRSRRITAREDMLSRPNMIRAWRHCSTRPRRHSPRQSGRRQAPARHRDSLL